MSSKSLEFRKSTATALAAGGAVFMSIATPVNLLFILLIVMARFAMFNEQLIIVGMISTLALLTAAVAAGLLAMIFVGFDKTLSSRNFKRFLGLAFVIPLVIWSFEIFNDIAEYQWLYVAGLATIMLVFSLYLVPRLRDVYRSKGIMA